VSDAVKPEKITKPIQLLGAWLVGLLAIDSCFLIAATRMPADSWEMRALVVAAIINVPLFLLAVFLLQTKFRPEMQEDSYYATYLSSKTNERIVITKDDAKITLISQRIAELESRITTPQEVVDGNGSSILANVAIGINKFLEDRDEIGERLARVGVAGYLEFGAVEAPEERAVAISQYLPAETREYVLRLARDLGFRRYTMFDNVEEQAEEEILFGCYGGPLRVIAGSQ